jgi:site-specific DNA-methyltransferase (adenine-specific)
MKTPPKINLYNVDCMEFMRGLPDNAYDLAIVDPPYGIGESKKSNRAKVNGKKQVHKPNKKWNNPVFRSYKPKKWDDNPPPSEYFEELLRVSKNQIIWGGNYFSNILPPSSCWIFWDKKRETNDFSDGELAWASFKKGLKKFEYLWDGFRKQKPEPRFHPTQKPVALYKWLLSNYASEGDKILDTHGGSMSIAIACHDKGFDLDLCELDKDYFEAGKKRYLQHAAQLKIC